VLEQKAVPVTATERPHAISPDRPYYEAPELTLPAKENEDLAPPVSTEMAAAQSPSVEPEMFRVTEAAAIRNGPSETAKVIGKATPGAELQVKRNENGWIQFVDPSSGNSGWIRSNVVADAKGSTDTASAASEEAQSANLKKNKPVKKAARQKPPSANTAQPRSKPDGRYAELPNDEEFLPDRGSRRMGLFARRRMLREGLMSPGFLPP
jgi:Bacterial SH3 domain